MPAGITVEGCSGSFDNLVTAVNADAELALKSVHVLLLKMICTIPIGTNRINF